MVAEVRERSMKRFVHLQGLTSNGHGELKLFVGESRQRAQQPPTPGPIVREGPPESLREPGILFFSRQGFSPSLVRNSGSVT